MAINIGYEPAGLSALAALVLGEAARADEEQRRSQAAGGANMQTALAALNANADRGAGNMLARGYSGGQFISTGGGGGGGGSAQATTARLAREIGGVNSTPQERAQIQAELLGLRAPQGSGGGRAPQPAISSKQGSLDEARAYDFDRTPQSVQRALYSTEDAASVDRISTQIQGYQELERLQQQGRVEVQGLISDRQNMKLGLPTRSDEVRRAQLNAQIQEVQIDESMPDDVKSAALADLTKERDKIPTRAQFDLKKLVTENTYRDEEGNIWVPKNSPVEVQNIRNKQNAAITPQQVQAKQKELAKEYKSEGEAILDELNQNIQAQSDLLDKMDTMDDPKEMVAAQSELGRLMAESKRLRDGIAKLQPPSAETIAKEVMASRATTEKVQEIISGRSQKQSPAPNQQALQMEEQIKAKAGAAWPRVEADIRSLTEKVKAETDPARREDAKAALLFYITQVQNGVIPSAP